MKIGYALAATVGLATVLLIACFLDDAASAQEKPAAVAQKWEYKMVAKDVDGLAPRNPRNEEAEFNQLGADGWELCATVGPATNKGLRFVYFIFKRPSP